MKRQRQNLWKGCLPLLLMLMATPGLVQAQTCNAQFSAGTQGTTLHISFLNHADTSLNYSWDFGDGHTSTDRTPSHQYADTGAYEVKLVVTGPQCADSSTQWVNAQCRVMFQAWPNGMSYHFQDSSSANYPAQRIWSFGDGTWDSTSSSYGINHTYSQPGVYEVCLTIIDSQGYCPSISTCDSIRVEECAADFSYSLDQDGHTVSFYNQSNPSSLNYEWHFGDRQMSNASNPVHSYAVADTYQVVLLVFNNNCTDTTLQTVITTQDDANCSASFSYSATNQEVSFSSSGSTGDSYAWTFGDGQTSTQMNPQHTYTQPGIYAVCLTVSDSATSCQTTTCDSVQVVPATCIADFSYRVNNNSVQFSNHSSGNSLNYSWDFGDGHMGSSAGAFHSYSAAGTYTVTLIVSNNFCSDTVAKTVTISGPTQSILRGNVYLGPTQMTADEGVVYLIQYDSASQTLTALDTTSIDSGMYFFSNVSPGSYLVKAALDTSSSHYSSYLPTYHDTSLYWSYASYVITGTLWDPVADIYMRAGVNPGGPGFIGGNVNQGANRMAGPGDPLEGVLVLLLDGNYEPVAYTYTDAIGRFEFDNLPLQQYYVFPEEINKQTQPLAVELTQDQQEVMDVRMWVGSAVITGLLPQPFDRQLLNLSAVPNPSSGKVTLTLQQENPQPMTVRVLNSQGKVVQAVQWQANSTESRLELSLEELPKGLYFLDVSTVRGDKGGLLKVMLR